MPAAGDGRRGKRKASATAHVEPPARIGLAIQNQRYLAGILKLRYHNRCASTLSVRRGARQPPTSHPFQ
jgi:hypothetical protein